MAAKRRADSATSSFSILCIMLIPSIMFIALYNKLEIAGLCQVDSIANSLKNIAFE